ncbi:Hypothetical predicted protein, partial [Pelobates cultripes]
AVEDGAIPPRKRAPGQAKSARSWKRARAHEDSSDSDQSLEEEYDDPYMDQYCEDNSDSGSDVKPVTASQKVTAQGSEPTRLGDPDWALFDTGDLRHACSAEWEPPEHIARYLALRVRKPLSKEGRSKLPILPDSVGKTPD